MRSNAAAQESIRPRDTIPRRIVLRKRLEAALPAVILSRESVWYARPEHDMNSIEIPGLELLEKLGEGGMASVWKARQLSLDRIVAVKILPADLAGDTADVQRFHAEAKSAAKLKHSGIVQVYDVKLEQGLHYIVMEHIAGYTVLDWLRRKERLTEGEALQVADCVADALDYAWEKERIIHCDIKPDNIMVDSDGTVKVADLGLARSTKASAGGPVEAHIFGTPPYMSPEQVMGASDLDCRSDIYSLGAMLYELLTGQYLFHGNTDEKIMEMQVKDTVEDPIVLVPKLSRGTFWLLEKMLAKDRAKRQQSWAEVEADIARVRKGKVFGPLLVDGESTVRRSKQRTGLYQAVSAKMVSEDGERSIIPLVCGVLAMIALVVVVAFFFLRSGDKPKPQQRPPPVSIKPVAVDPAEVAAGKSYDEAVIWVQDNPGQFDAAIARFKTAAAMGSGTKYAAMAESEVMKLSNARDFAIQTVLSRLKERIAPLKEAGKYGDAAGIYEAYDGELAAETRSRRLSIARQLREDQRRIALESQQSGPNAGTSGTTSQPPPANTREKIDHLLDAVAAKLMTEGLDGAQSELAAGMASSDLSSHADELQPVRDLLDGTCAVNSRIVHSFASQRGRQMIVNLNGGPIDFVVSDVKDGRVFGTYKRKSGGTVADIPMSFGFKELAPSEKVHRMGLGESHEISLAKGLLALSSRAYPLAKNYFAKTHPMLSDRLVARVPKQ